MKRKLSIVGAVIVATLLTAGACPAPQQVSGTVRDKYIEDFTEHTLVVETVTGEKHHFTVEADDWRSAQVGTPWTATEQAGEDD